MLNNKFILGLAALSWGLFIVIVPMAGADHLAWPDHINLASVIRTINLLVNSPFTQESAHKWLLLALVINMVSMLFWVAPVVICSSHIKQSKEEERRDLKLAEDLSVCGYLLGVLSLIALIASFNLLPVGSAVVLPFALVVLYLVRKHASKKPVKRRKK